MPNVVKARSYKLNLHKLHQKLSKQLASVSEEFIRTRRSLEDREVEEQVLIDLINHQDVVLGLLQNSSKPAAQAQTPHPALEAEMSATAAVEADATGLSSCRSSRTGSYTTHLLLAASVKPQQMSRVMEMTTSEWSCLFNSCFQQLLVLLELVTREEDEDTAESNEAVQLTSTATAAAAALSECWSGCESGNADNAEVSTEDNGEAGSMATTSTGSSSSSGGSGSTIPASQGDTEGSAGSRAAAADVPAPATQVQPTTAAAVAADVASSKLQLQQLVDEWVSLCLLATIYNHMPLFRASQMNHSTGQLCLPPASHFARAVSRAGITPTQAQHLALCRQQAHRLQQNNSQERDSLVKEASHFNLLVQAAQAEQQQNRQQEQQQEWEGRQEQHGGIVTSPAAGDNASEQQLSEVVSDPLHCNKQQPADVVADLLQRNLKQIPLQSQMINSFICNTLTHVQMAKMLVSCWPFMPVPGRIIAIAADMYEHHQQLGAEEQQRQQQNLQHHRVHQSPKWQQRLALLQQQQQCWLDEMNEQLQRLSCQ